jgi:hypothetical protein
MCKFNRCEIAQHGCAAGHCYNLFPGRQHGSDLGERSEQRLVSKFVWQAGVEAQMKAFWVDLPGAI